MEPRLSLVTLAVTDIARARTFYDTLGFVASRASNSEVVFYDAGGVVLALFGRKALAEDANVDMTGSGFGGFALAHNTRSEREVDEVLREAERAGGRIVKGAERAFWGGYSGYFEDPDGHLWEVAYNPSFPLDDAGRVTLPPADLKQDRDV